MNTVCSDQINILKSPFSRISDSSDYFGIGGGVCIREFLIFLGGFFQVLIMF